MPPQPTRSRRIGKARAGRPLPSLPAANGISPCEDAVDQCRDCRVKVGFAVLTAIVRMRRSCIPQYADDFSFWQDIAVVQREQKRLADCEGCRSGYVGDIGHGLTFLGLASTLTERMCLRLRWHHEVL